MRSRVLGPHPSPRGRRETSVNAPTDVSPAGLTVPATGEERARPSSARRLLGAVFAEAYVLPTVWVLLIVFFMLLPQTQQQFTNPLTYSVIFGIQSVPLVLAIAVLIPMLAGDFDVSTPQTLLLASMIMGVLTVKQGLPVWLAIVTAVVVGAVIGVVNGVLCALVGLDSFIVTLGTGSLIWGVAIWISDREVISGIDDDLSTFFLQRVAFLPVEFYIAIALTAVVWWWTRYIPSGRRLTYIGDHRDVARLSGVRVNWLRIGAFGAAGMVAALAGIAKVAQSGSADPSGNTNLLLAAFASVFLGGTTITPGRFNAWGTAIATLFLGTGVTALQILGLSSWIQQIFFGVALVGGVLFSWVAARRRAAREEREALLRTVRAEPGRSPVG